ncbi:hypothetical protein BD311DRAFT_411916 [Dichomitus squalens]|uniref:Uncharacterized protein n=1 Tax=Dichomitus squalens TaxID=114155 RepID=A0A4V6MVW5_9APHY|nr:hypothetical protein BD311DRAFT_411916 [Dichomitus squalens]
MEAPRAGTLCAALVVVHDRSWLLGLAAGAILDVNAFRSFIFLAFAHIQSLLNAPIPPLHLHLTTPSCPQIASRRRRAPRRRPSSPRSSSTPPSLALSSASSP